MTDFRTLTVIVDVRTGSVDALRDLLDGFGDAMQGADAAISFARSDTIHFARWVLIEPLRDDQRAVTRLVFSCNHDGPAADQLVEVVDLATAAVDAIYSMCDGYPALDQRTPRSRADYLLSHRVKVNSIYIGAPDRTLRQIRDEARLRDGIETYLDTRDFARRRPAEVVADVRRAVAADPTLAWAVAPAPPRAKTLLNLVVAALVALPLVPFAALWLLTLRLACERVEMPLDLMPSGLDPELVSTLERREDIYVQNQFSQLMVVKPGWIRQRTLRAVLWASNFAARNVFTRGKIAGIPSIHFYSWIVLDGGRRLLFLSNFDGSWQSYLGDFIDKAAFALNGVLSNCDGFPVTWFLFFKGVTDVEHYKAWARNANIPTQVWYTGYPTLDVKNVNANSDLRLGLVGEADDAQAAAWLQLL